MMATRWAALAIVLLAAGPACAGWTYVYVNNHTGMELTVKTETNIHRKYWKQTTTRVPAGKRVEVLCFSRLDGVAEDVSYRFDTTVSAGASRYVITQQVKGTAMNSQMRHSVEGDELNDDNVERHSTWVLDDGRAIPIKYAALSAGFLGAGFDDVGYRFGAPLELPKTAGPVKVLAYNTWMLPTGLSGSFHDCRGQSERGALMPARLAGYDALMLSELFDDDVRRNLVRALKAEYPFYTGVVGTDGGIEQDGGVIIMSRWPLTRHRELRFAGTSAGADALSDKGAMYAKMWHPHGPIHLVATHTQADYPGEKHSRLRGAQFGMISAFLDELKLPASEPVLIGGDLNVDSVGAPAEFATAMKLLDAEAPATEGDPYTWNPPENSLAKGGPERLDHVVWLSGHRRPGAATSRVVKPQGRWSAGEPEHLSDHFGLEAILDFGAGPQSPIARALPAAGPAGTLLGIGGE